MTKEDLNKARNEGNNLRDQMAKRINGKNTVTLSYGLLNALQAGDKNRFLQLVIRQYLSLNLHVPKLFIDTIADDEAFRAIGNAFLIGLSPKNDSNGKEKEKKA